MSGKQTNSTDKTKASDAVLIAEAPIKSPGKRGGRRPGAGRKPDYFKRLGVSPLTAAQILQRYDEREAWHWFLKHKNPAVRFKAWEYLTDRRDGKPKQAVDLSASVNHTATVYRNPMLAGLSDAELQAFAETCRKLEIAAPDAPVIQANSDANGAVQCPMEGSQEQKRETTFPMANGNGLRTQPTGEGPGPIIEIPATEPQPDGAA
jgi:hypothetical protein